MSVDMTERMSSGITSGELPKLVLPIQGGSVNKKDSLLVSFWKLIKFRPTLNVFKPLDIGLINSKLCL
jgi:hypothetical protein